MDESKLETAIQKLNGEQSSYLFENLKTFPENAWFNPTNADGNKYSICDQLSQQGLICKRSIPIQKNGVWCGQRVSFLYRLDLDYRSAN